MKKQNNNITTLYHDIKYISIRSKHPSPCIATSKKNKILKANDNLYEKNYNLLEQFIPLIGGGEFRWHFKHLSDSI